MDQPTALHYSSITRDIGAQVTGMNLTAADQHSMASIRAALSRFKVLFFREQPLTLEQLLKFSQGIGPLIRVPYIRPMEQYPDVIAVLKEAEEQDMGVFGGDWHSDFSFLAEPPAASILYSAQVPPVGGDTLWIDMSAAFEALDDGLQTRLLSMTAIHSGAPYGKANAPDKETQFTGSIQIDRDNPEADLETRHPAVCLHPDTGERMLFINPTYTTRFAGMSRERSMPLLHQLYAHCTRPEFSIRFRWTPATVAIWDNRSTMHYAVNDYDGYRRLMYRTTIAGSAPIAASPAD